MSSPTDTDLDSSPPSAEVVAQLVARHRDFLAFLEPRVASRAVAEEILQAAYVRTLEKGSTIRDDTSAVGWFYRVLRNALVDHYRKRAGEGRLAEKLASVTEEEAVDEEVHRAVCACVRNLLPTLKPEYAGMLERVELDGAPLPEVATELGITPNNAWVRLHRARQALKKQVERCCGACATHGCLDCTCRHEPAAGS
jgi:RNA polymerase sigma factor (sigma-70 family)